jgi:hypothetical protein
VIVAAWLLASSVTYVVTSLLNMKPRFDLLLRATALALVSALGIQSPT